MNQSRWTIGQLRVDGDGKMVFVANGITTSKKGVVPTILTDLRNQGWKIVSQSQGNRVNHPDQPDHASTIELYTFERRG